jgi:hypothetical protein
MKVIFLFFFMSIGSFLLSQNNYFIKNQIRGDLFQSFFDQKVESGYALVKIDGYFYNGKSYFDTTWEKVEEYDFIAKFNLLPSVYEEVFDELASKGYIMTYISTYSDDRDNIYFAGVWEKNCGEDYMVRHGITYNELLNIDVEMQAYGLERIVTDNFRFKGKEYYAAIWRLAIHNLSVTPIPSQITQPTGFTCWATVGTIMSLWRKRENGGREAIPELLDSLDRISSSRFSLANKVNYSSIYQNSLDDPSNSNYGLKPEQSDLFFLTKLGLDSYTTCRTLAPFSWIYCNKPIPSVRELKFLLCNYGPLAFEYSTGAFSSHIVVIYGVEVHLNDLSKSKVIVIDLLSNESIAYNYDDFYNAVFIDWNEKGDEAHYDIYHWR